jgi:chromosome segregation ATPase
MVFEVTLTNAITVLALFFAALWGVFKRLLDKQEQRQVEREKRFEERAETLSQLITTVGDGYTLLRERVTRMESRSVFGHDDASEIYERINGLADSVSKLAGEFSAVRRTLDVIQEFLLKGGKS